MTKKFETEIQTDFAAIILTFWTVEILPRLTADPTTARAFSDLSSSPALLSYSSDFEMGSSQTNFAGPNEKM